MARLTSESYIKITLIILLGLVVCGFFVYGSHSSWSWNFGRATLSQIGNAEVDANTVKNIEIDWAAGSVDVKTHSNGNNIIITESASGNVSKAQEMRWQVVGDTLKIDYGTWFSCMSFQGSKHLEISIPQSLAKNMGTLNIDGASGSYVVNDIDCQNFRVSLASGSLEAQGMIIDDLRLETASGNASVEGQISNEIKLDTASGQVNVTCKKVSPRTIDADMASGTVTVSIPENDGFTATIGKLSGNFHTDFATQQNGDTYTYKNGGSTTIKADMASGQFLLKKTA